MWTAQQNFPDALRITFEETIRPELISILRESLPQSPPNDQCITQDTLIANLSEHYQLISAEMEELKQQIKKPQIIQQNIRSSLLSQNTRLGQKALPGLQEPRIRASRSLAETSDLNERGKESLSEV